MLNAAKITYTSPVLHILYASHTGNGEGIATNLAGLASRSGYTVQLKSFLQVGPAALRKLETAVFIVSTHGDGDAPDDSLNLNLKIYRPRLSPARQEARFGRLWQDREAGIRRYNLMNKVEPMERAQAELEVGTWFSGIRCSQSDSRRRIRLLQPHGSVVKVHPLADWSNRDLHRYLQVHDLPYHPLWERGYVSVGDHHTSRPLGAGMSEQGTRFFGLVRECGLHEADNFTAAD